MSVTFRRVVVLLVTLLLSISVHAEREFYPKSLKSIKYVKLMSLQLMFDSLRHRIGAVERHRGH